MLVSLSESSRAVIYSDESDALTVKREVSEKRAAPVHITGCISTTNSLQIVHV